MVLENTGLIESQSGVLQLFGGGNLAGQLVTATGARIDLAERRLRPHRDPEIAQPAVPTRTAMAAPDVFVVTPPCTPFPGRATTLRATDLFGNRP